MKKATKRKLTEPDHYWNHRIMAHEYKGIITFQIHEVYYTNGVADSCTTDSIGLSGDSIKELNQTLTWIRKCLKKPVLWYGTRFPEVYKPTGISIHK